MSNNKCRSLHTDTGDARVGHVTHVTRREPNDRDSAQKSPARGRRCQRRELRHHGASGAEKTSRARTFVLAARSRGISTACEPAPRNLITLDQSVRDPWRDSVAPSVSRCRSATRKHDARTSVVNADLRVHGIGNMYVFTSGNFVTSGPANPTLPIVAFAHRLAEHLSARLRADSRALSRWKRSA